MDKLEIKPEYPDTKTDQPLLGVNVMGRFKTVSTKTTGVPATYLTQIEIYINGGTKLLRIYDIANKTWRELTIL